MVRLPTSDLRPRNFLIVLFRSCDDDIYLSTADQVFVGAIHCVLRPPLARGMITRTPLLYILGSLLILGRRLGPEPMHFETMSWMQHAPQ